MTATAHSSRITLEQLNSTIARYQHVVREKLRDLDVFRYETIPAAKSAADKPELTKAELEKLVEWKL